MAPITKKNTLFAKVCGRVIMMVDICIQCVHPECSKLPSKENKANSYKWFTEEHFSRLISKLEDVILARVWAPSETSKKKTGKTSCHDTSDILPDPDLLIQYQFVKRRKYKQSVLIRSKQESLLYDKRKNTGQSKYSGGGYESVDYFPEKLKVTVSQTTLDVMPSVARLAQDSAEEKPRKSTISKYFNKGTADMTHSTQKKRAALKNMNKKQDLKKKIDSLLCTTSSDSDEKGGGLTELEVESEQRHNQISWVEHLDELDIQDNLTSQGVITSKEVKPESRFTSKEKGENANGSGELEGEHERRHNPISWVKHLDELDIQDNLESQGVVTSKDVKPESRFTSKEKCVNANGSGKLEGEPERRHNQKSWIKELNELDIQDNLACLEVVSLKGAKQECDRNIASRHSDESGTDAFSYSDTCNITSSSSPKVKECTTAGNEGDVSLNYLNNHETVMKDKDKNSKQSGSTTSKLKRPRSDSESDSDSLPSLRSRLASKTFLKKQKTVRVNQTGDKRKESDSNSVHVGEDNDFETPKLKRNVDKRKGSDLSDDQDLCLLSSTHNLPGSSNSDVKEGLCSKKKKPSRTNVTTVQESSKKTRKLVQKKINKRQVKTSSKTTSDVVEDVNEEPGSSPLEPITIEDKPPVALDVSTVEDLTADQTEQLVWEHSSELREIFEGKKYCRRHEDYKKGGRMKGDLAFQVQFGQFSEEQRDTIIGVLTAMFCYKHTKYFDYVSKVLLPETLVMLYMKVVGRSRDEAEMSLLERTT